MTPQIDIPVAANVLGTIGTFLWCVQLVPQIWTNWRSKKTDGLPGSMMFLWALCGVPLGVYSIIQNFNIPLQVQPQCFMAFCLVSWVQILIYSRRWSTWLASITGLGVAIAFAGAEAALILTLRPVYEAGNNIAPLVVGIMANILLALGLLPPYGEILKRRGRVIGINWVFLSMDWLGSFFSLMALVAQHTFDVLGGVIYIVCCLLELGIVISHLIWLFRTRGIRKEAAAAGKTFDDLAADYERQGLEFKFSERKSWKTRPMDLESVAEGTETTLRSV